MAAPIDNLSVHVLQRIISFLPTKLAIRTSVLSEKWKNVWKGSSSVCIIYSGDESWAIPITDTIYGLTIAKLSTFHLRVDKVPRRDNDIDDWLYSVMERKPDNMSIRFIGLDHGYLFMDEFFDNDWLKRLTLEHPTMTSKLTNVSWKSLTHLSLNCPYLPQETLAKIIVGCPLLKSLTLCQCQTQLVSFDLSESPNILSLDIDMDHWDYTHVSAEPVKIEAPHIRYFKLSFCSHCVLVDVSSLLEAKLDVNPSRWLPKVQDSLLDMMLKLQNVNKLTFGSTFLKALSLAQVHDIPFPTLKVEDLTLETMILTSVIPGIRRLLQNSPTLKQLTIDIVKLPEEEAADAGPAVHTFLESLLMDAKTLKELVVRLGDSLTSLEIENLARMTQDFGRKYDVSFVLNPDTVRSFSSFFNDTACSEHVQEG